MKLAVPLLAAAAFAMLTNEFNIIGVIPLIARDLDVSVSQVGLLVTAFAFTVAIAGPFLTIAVRTVERRFLFTVVLAVTAIGAVIAALAPNYGVLAGGRILSALALPVFWSVATSTAARAAGPEKAARAITTVFSGISIASVLGSPITTIVAGVLGWRAAFGVGAAICAAMAIAIWFLFPRIEPDADSHPDSPWQVVREPVVVVNLLMSFVALTAMFTSYTYLADTLSGIGRLDKSVVGWVLMGFGVAGIIGNSIAGRFLDASPMRASVVAIAITGIAMVAFGPSLENPVFAIIALAVWGASHAAGFVTNHVRAIRSAPEHQQELTASLNVSVFNAGIGTGAVVGGRVIEAIGLPHVGAAGAMIGVFALLLAVAIVRSRQSDRASRRAKAA